MWDKKLLYIYSSRDSGVGMGEDSVVVYQYIFVVLMHYVRICEYPSIYIRQSDGQ